MHVYTAREPINLVFASREPEPTSSRMAYIDDERDLSVVATTVVVGLVPILFLLLRWKLGQERWSGTVPLSVNYHFTRQCNYQCGFCFHTAKTSFVLPIDEAKRGLKMLKEAGTVFSL